MLGEALAARDKPRLALHEAVLPPLAPAHDHDHGPVPVKFAVLPAVHRFVFGAPVKTPPFDVPHWPLTAVPVEEGVSVA
jgi:hypothetical protein